MSEAAYLDTSAFLRLFLEEPDSGLVASLVQEPEELHALRLMLTEARVSLDRFRHDGRLCPEDHVQIGDRVSQYWKTQIQVINFTEDIFVAAERAATLQPGLRTLDALHLGAACVLREEVRPKPVSFITCDHRLLQAALAMGFRTPFKV